MARKKKRQNRKRRKTRKPEVGKEKEIEIGDTIEERMEHFGEEISAFFERIGKRIEKRSEEWKQEHEHWEHEQRHRHYEPFGLASPLISSIVGILILGFAVWGFSFLNARIESALLCKLYSFLLDNLALLFLISIFFSYTSYFSRTYPRAYLLVSPIITAVGIIIFLWVFVQIMVITGMPLMVPFFAEALFFIQQSLYPIFWLVLFLGYVVLVIKIFIGVLKVSYKSDYMARKRVSRRKARAGVRRLYRSGENKIIGGVCGGIGEYLDVDPVVVRLLWLFAILAWGSGLLLYIIAWIIIPRNPKHKW